MSHHVNVVQGQRFEPQLNPATGTIVAFQRVQLVRAEDPDRKTKLWQVVLSPVYQKGVGALVQGVPARHLAGDGTGNYLVTMTWGGGGVTFTTEFDYPASGASFCVAGDNVMLSITAQDFATVFTDATRPCVNAWVTPGAQSTSTRPLTDSSPVGGGGLPGIQPISPWARTLTISKSDPAATVLIEVARDVAGTFVTLANLTAALQSVTLPVPSRAIQLRCTSSAGSAFVMQDLVFT